MALIETKSEVTITETSRYRNCSLVIKRKKVDTGSGTGPHDFLESITIGVESAGEMPDKYTKFADTTVYLSLKNMEDLNSLFQLLREALG